MTTTSSVSVWGRLSLRRKPPDLAELMLEQMNADSEQRVHVVTMRTNERKDADRRREDECKEATRVREDNMNEVARVRVNERKERAKYWTAGINLIYSIASGYFTMDAEVQGEKRKIFAESREEVSV